MLKPVATRPQMTKDYGIKTEADGMLPWSYVDEQMTKARNLWVCTTRPDNRPHAMPVWGLWYEQTLYFSTDPKSIKGRNIAANPQVVIHLESGDNVVIFEGRVEKVSDFSILKPFGVAYNAKYPGFDIDFEKQADTMGLYFLQPQTAFAWLESDFPNTATRWHFE